MRISHHDCLEAQALNDRVWRLDGGEIICFINILMFVLDISFECIQNETPVKEIGRLPH